jgi:hypothetical protein
MMDGATIHHRPAMQRTVNMLGNALLHMGNI